MLFLQFQNKLVSWATLIVILMLPWCAQALTVGTHNSPPFSMHEDGADIGMVTEAVRQLLAEAKIKDYQIVEYPLARGLIELKYGRVDIYYPYVKGYDPNPDHYVLIGPIAKYNMALFVRNDYKKEVSFAAMKDEVIGAERGSIGSSELIKNHLHIEYATQQISCLRMVIAGRVSACAMGVLPGQYAAAINNLAHEIKYVEVDKHADLYVALRRSLPQEHIEQIRAAFERLREQDYFGKQQSNYEKKFSIFIKSLS